MTWEDFTLARQQLAEEFVGSPERAAREMEKQAAKESRKAMTRGAR